MALTIFMHSRRTELLFQHQKRKHYETWVTKKIRRKVAPPFSYTVITIKKLSKCIFATIKALTPALLHKTLTTFKEQMHMLYKYKYSPMFVCISTEAGLLTASYTRTGWTNYLFS